MSGLLQGDHPQIKKPAEKAEDKNTQHNGNKWKKCRSLSPK
jgi:hypothetical protein